jgi:DNA-binding transcriptional LysR family regulator
MRVMLERLRSFLEVYRRRSMGKAAHALSLTQPAVSQQIAVLEREFGAPLFDRTRTGVEPTAVADSLARDIGAAMDLLEASISARRAREPSLRGVIQLGAPAELFSVFGPRMIAGFAKTDLQVKVHLGGQKRLYRGLEDGSIDLAVLASKPPGPNYLAERLGEETLGLYAHPSICQQSGAGAASLDLLNTLPFFAYDEDLSLIRQFVREVFDGAVTARPTAIIPDLRAIAASCAARPAWTVLPGYLADSWSQTGQLVRWLPECETVNDFNLAFQRTALRTPRIAYARELIADAWMPLGMR